MRRFSGLRAVLPITHLTFLCGAAALAGFPLLSGFWSKDDILAVTLLASHEGPYAGLYTVLFISALTTAGLTAFYTGRAYFMTFWGELVVPPEAYLHHGHGNEAHAHPGHEHGSQHAHAAPDAHAAPAANDPHKHHFESPPVMTIPLQILAVGAVLVGIVFGPTGLFGGFLEHHWMALTGRGEGFPGLIPRDGEHAHNFVLMIGSSLIALAGIGLAYLLYVKNPAKAAELQRSMQGAYGLSRNKFYLDEIFAALFVNPLSQLAQISRLVDTYLVDGIVDLVGQLPAAFGALLRPLQNGLVQFYALLMALGVAGFMLAVLLR
jgi:NADH-quinone oxidoreductase subunit L